MNKPIQILLAAFLGLLLISIQANSQCTNNLLTNPGFESGLTGWTTTGDVTIITAAHTGTKAAHLGGNGYASVGQAFAASPGNDYTLKAWSKYTGSLGYRAVELRFLNSAWVNISTNSIYAVSTSNYAECVLSGTAPVGTAYVYLLASKDGPGSIDVDDLCLTLGNTGGPVCTITPSVTNIVCNDNGTPNNPADDRFSFTVNATNPVLGTGYQMVSPQLSQTYHGTYGSALYIQNVPISTGNVHLNFTDNITANCSAATMVTAPAPCSTGGQLPDLNGIVHEIIPAVNNCFTPPGQSFVYLSMQINNTGSVAAGAFKVKFYFSLDNSLSSNDVFWTTANLSSLNTMNNGGPAFISPNVPVPANLPPNRYYMIVTIDSDSQVAESNEANNTITPFQVEIGAPDISLVSHSGLPANVAAGSSFPMQVTVKYLSNGYPLPTNTSMTIAISLVDVSPVMVVGTANYLISDFGQSNTLTKTVQVNLPANLTLGSRYFNISAGYSFCEEPSNNSQFQYANVTGTPGQIDLELSMAQNTANPVIYSNYTTTLTLVNKGPQAATGVKVKWMKPVGVVYTGGNEFVASQGSFNPNGDQVWTVGSVPANGSATLRVSYFLLQNGAPITYAQVTAANETDVDSQPNNGTPPTVNQDDEASSGGTAPPILTPDLTISNLIFSNGPGTPGQVLAYNFDLANIGNGNAPQDFIVRAWISTNPTFNTTGIQDGIVPTGNFIAGFSVAEVPGASMLPSTLAAGQYYLHLWVDADAQVTESNENNNTVSAPFLVQAAAGPGVCDDLIGGGSISCLTHSASGNLVVHYANNGNYRKATLDGTGQVIGDQASTAPPAFPSYRIANGNLEKMIGTTVAYSYPIPAALTSQYSYFLNFTEFNSGYVIFAMKTGDSQLYAIRTDGNIVAQQTGAIGNFGPQYYVRVTAVVQVSSNEMALTLVSGSTPTMSAQLLVINGNLQVLSNLNIESGAWGANASIVPNACGQFLVNSSFSNYAHRGSWNGNKYRMGRFENGQFITDYLYEVSEQTSMGYGSRGHSWMALLADGSTIKGYNGQSLPYTAYPPNYIVRLEKKQGSTVIWEKYVKLSAPGTVRWLAMSGNEVVFLSEKNNAVFVEAMNCVDNPNPKPDLAIFNASVYPNPIQAGSSFTPYLSVFNLDLGAANGFELRAVLSTDNLYSPATDILVGSLTGVSLAPGANSTQTLNAAIPANIASGNYQLILVADAGNAIAESNENNNNFVLPLTVTGGGTPPTGCNAVTITSGPSQITIAGFSAPHVLIKVFRPNWTVAFECLDNCANPLVVNGLPNGTYHVQVKLIDNGWGTICFLERDVAVNSFGGGNGSGIAKQEDRLSLTFENIYPNPSAYQVFVDLFSPKEQAAKLDFYDMQGRIVHTMNVELEEGVNTLDVMVYDWKSGTYNVIARGEESALPAYGRFLKVWEE